MTISITYHAQLREQRGLKEETLDTHHTRAHELYHDLKTQHGFSLQPENMRLAVNDELKAWDYVLQDGDSIAFIPPVAGG